MLDDGSQDVLFVTLPKHDNYPKMMVKADSLSFGVVRMGHISCLFPFLPICKRLTTLLLLYTHAKPFQNIMCAAPPSPPKTTIQYHVTILLFSSAMAQESAAHIMPRAPDT